MGDIAKLKLKIDREGYLNKNATAKEKDEVRGNWNVRYFMLRGSTLAYYKKKGDNDPKGEMDLRLAVIDDADAKVGKPFSIRIAQARQMFTYVIANDSEDKKEWLRALRRAAGYQEDELDDEMAAQKAKQPRERSSTLASFGCLLKSDSDVQHPDRCVIILQPDRSFGLAMDGRVSRAYPGTSIQNVLHSTESDIRLVDTTGAYDLFSMTVTFQTPQGNVKYVFYLGSQDEATMLWNLVQSLKQGEFTLLKQHLDQKVIHSGSVMVGDLSMTGNWHKRHAALTESRCLIYQTAESATPLWAILLGTTKLSKSGNLAIQVKTGIETIMFKYETEDIRDLWYKGMKTISKAQRQQAEEEKPKEKEEKEQVFIAEPEKGDEEEPPAPPPHDEMELDLPVASTLEEGENTFVVSWGLNDAGQLGTRTKEDALVPTVIKQLEGKKVKWLAAGGTHAAAITDKGHVYMWGLGEDFQLGLGKTNKQSSAPYLVTNLIQRGHVVMVSCGHAHTLAITDKGELFSWGSNSHGQLGVGGNAPAFYPQQVPGPEGALAKQHVTYVSAGYEHSACIVGQGEVWLWGENKEGALGTGNKIHFDVPKRNDHLLEKGPAKQVECGNNTTAVLTNDGLVYTFGRNKHGQLGHGDTETKHMPTAIQLFKRQNLKVVMIGVGEDHMIALVIPGGDREAREVYTWGKAVANGFQEDQVLPAKVSALETHARYVCAGKSHSISINDKLNMFSFGVNRAGELGNGKAGVQALVKVRLSSKCQVVQAACGGFFSLALCRGKVPSKLLAAEKAEREKDKADPGKQDFKDFQKAVDEAINSGAELTLDSSTEVIRNLLSTVNTDPKKATRREEAEFQNLGGSALDMLNAMENADGAIKPAPEKESIYKRKQQPQQQQAQAQQHPVEIDEGLITFGGGGGGGAAGGAPGGGAVGGGHDGQTFTIGVVPDDLEGPLSPKVSSPGAGPSPVASPAASPRAAAAHQDKPDKEEEEHNDEDKKKKKELPPGWRKVKDEKTGRSYYYNKKTKEVQWKRPKA